MEEANIAVIDNDTNAIRGALRPLEEAFSFGYFESLEKLIAQLGQAEEEPPAESDDGEGEEKAEAQRTYLKPLDMIIIDIEMLPGSPLSWLNEIQDKLKKLNALRENNPVKIVFTSFEMKNTDLLNLRHKDLYDIMVKPFDPPLLLQKVEMILGLPEITKPKHLYHHNIEQEIEISRNTPLSEISEYGFKLMNPAPLKPGVFAHFRLALASGQVPIRFTGRCYGSEEAGVPGYHTCKFTFFGIEPESLREIRLGVQKLVQNKEINKSFGPKEEKLSKEERALRIKQKLASRAQSGPAGKGAQAQKNEAEEAETQQETLDVVIVDMDRDSISQVEGALTQNFPYLRIHKFNTYMNFLKSSVDKSAGTQVSADWKDPAFSWEHDEVEFLIDPESCGFVSIETPPPATAKFFGYEAPDLFLPGNGWHKIFHKEAMDSFDELIRFAQTEGRSEMELLLVNADEQARYFDVVAEKTYIPEELKITIKDRPTHMQKEDSAGDGDLKKIDLLVINANYIGKSPRSWLEGFQMQMGQAGLIPAGGKIPIMTTVPAAQADLKRYFCMPIFQGFFTKPIDRRLLVQNAAILFGHKDKTFQDSYMSSVEYDTSIEVGRPIKIEEISEYGVVMKARQAMKPGAIGILHSDVLTNEQGQGTIARCLGFEPHPDDEKIFQIHFLFYGIQDETLKRMRKWIREEYIQAKEGSGGD